MRSYNAERIRLISFLVDTLDFFEIAWTFKVHGSVQGSFYLISPGVNDEKFSKIYTVVGGLRVQKILKFENSYRMTLFPMTKVTFLVYSAVC